MAQFLRPNSDITVNLFSPTPLYQQIDEVTRSDADLISSSANQTGLAEVGLSSGTDPGVSTGHVLRYTYNRTITNKNYTMVVRLMQGTTVIASWTHANPSTSLTLAEQTLTGTQADNITDYTNLRVQFDVTVAAGGGGQMQVSWCEFEIPGETAIEGAAALSGEGLLGATGLGIASGAAAMAGEGLLGADGSSDEYWLEVAPDAPDAWWRFTETTGASVNDEIGTNDLTVTGANLNTTGPINTGSAVSFDGTDDKAESGNSLGWDGAHSLTVEAWIKASSWTTASATPDSVFLLWVDESGNLAFQVRDSADTTWAVASTTTPSTGSWHHVVGVWDRTQQKALLYVDGSLANSSAAQSFTDIGALSEIVQVGTDGGTVFAAFELDELAIYNEALSSTRIAAHYETGSGTTGGATGEAALLGEGDAAASGLTKALGAVAVAGSGLVAAAGLAIALTAAALSGSGDVAGAGLARALSQGALDGSGALVGSGLTAALGASGPSGDGVISAAGVTVSFGAAAFAGEGDIVGNASATLLGEAALFGEGVFAADGEATALAAGILLGEGSLVGTGTTESFGAADIDGAGDLYGSASDIKLGESDLLGEGTLVGSGLTLSYAEATISGEGVVGASGLAASLGNAALDGSGDIAAAGETEALAAADLTGEGDLYGASSTGTVQGAVAFDGSGDIGASAVTVAYGTVVCNASGFAVVAGADTVVADADTVVASDLGCRYIFGEGDLYGSSGSGSVAAATLTGQGNLLAQGNTSDVFALVSWVEVQAPDPVGALLHVSFVELQAPNAVTISFGGSGLAGEGVLVANGIGDTALVSIAFVGEGDFYADARQGYGPPPWLNLPPYFIAVEVKDGSGTVVFNAVATVGNVTTSEWETPVAGGTPTSPSWDEEIG